MPSEKFYPSDAVQGEDSEYLEVSWGHEQLPVTTLVSYYSSNSSDREAVTIGHFEFERSGLNRLIRSLRRARNATFGGDE